MRLCVAPSEHISISHRLSVRGTRLQSVANATCCAGLQPIWAQVQSSAVHVQAHGEGETLTAARCDECEVTTRWLGFYRVWQGSGEVFDTVDLFLPDVQFNTQVTCPSAYPHAGGHAAQWLRKPCKVYSKVAIAN